jgi:hypothetical protein
VQTRGKEIYSDVQSRGKDLVDSAKKAVSRKKPAESD